MYSRNQSLKRCAIGAVFGGVVCLASGRRYEVTGCDVRIKKENSLTALPE